MFPVYEHYISYTHSMSPKALPVKGPTRQQRLLAAPVRPALQEPRQIHPSDILFVGAVPGIERKVALLGPGPQRVEAARLDAAVSSARVGTGLRGRRGFRRDPSRRALGPASRRKPGASRSPILFWPSLSGHVQDDANNQPGNTGGLPGCHETRRGPRAAPGLVPQGPATASSRSVISPRVDQWDGIDPQGAGGWTSSRGPGLFAT